VRSPAASSRPRLLAESARQVYVDGQALAGVFAWLRPNDLVWNYFVNNYLLGKEPPAFDILYWNQDTVRLAAGLDRDFVRIGLENALTRPGEAEVPLAARRPDRISHAISMGADLQGLFGDSDPTLFAVGVARRVVHASGRGRRDACLLAHCGCPFSHDFARRCPFEQVRLTSIYSKGDGVVHWQCQLVSHADRIEVTGSHVGLISNRKVYRAVVGALALPELTTPSA
jgi:hypothetical protein